MFPGWCRYPKNFFPGLTVRETVHPPAYTSGDARGGRIAAGCPQGETLLHGARSARTVHHTAVIVGTALLVAFTLHSALPGAGDSPFPDIAGWQLSGKPVTYTPENLWDFIDGAAESYLAYSFRGLYVGEYIGTDSIAVRVEFYRHADPANAFGMYATERAPDYSFMTIGAQGYQEEGVLNFLNDAYYVKLSTHQRGSDAEAALRMIAEQIDEHLGGTKKFPAGLNWLPARGRRPNTEGYIAQSFLGYGFLRNAFTARYTDGLQLFVLEYEAADSAAGALKQFLATAQTSTVGRDRYRIADPNNGTISVALSGRFLYGMVGTAGAAVEQRYLDLIEAELPAR